MGRLTSRPRSRQVSTDLGTSSPVIPQSTLHRRSGRHRGSFTPLLGGGAVPEQLRVASSFRLRRRATERTCRASVAFLAAKDSAVIAPETPFARRAHGAGEAGHGEIHPAVLARRAELASTRAAAAPTAPLATATGQDQSRDHLVESVPARLPFRSSVPVRRTTPYGAKHAQGGGPAYGATPPSHSSLAFRPERERDRRSCRYQPAVTGPCHQGRLVLVQWVSPWRSVASLTCRGGGLEGGVGRERQHYPVLSPAHLLSVGTRLRRHRVTGHQLGDPHHQIRGAIQTGVDFYGGVHQQVAQRPFLVEHAQRHPGIASHRLRLAAVAHRRHQDAIVSVHDVVHDRHRRPVIAARIAEDGGAVLGHERATPGALSVVQRCHVSSLATDFHPTHNDDAWMTIAFVVAIRSRDLLPPEHSYVAQAQAGSGPSPRSKR